MNAGRIVFFGLLVVAATTATAKYERTLDGKTKVWQGRQQRQLQVSWSGDRDDKGYATGQGTVTWFKPERSWLTGSRLPKTRYIEVSQYKGKMVEGKLDGTVIKTDGNGNTSHAQFADGKKTSDWVAGPTASSRKPSEPESSKPSVAQASPPAVERPTVTQPSPAAEAPAVTQPSPVAEAPAVAQSSPAVETPAEAPPPPPVLNQHVAEKPSSTPSQAKDVAVITNSPAGTASPATEAVRSLAMPPSSLRMASLSEPSAKPSTPAVETNDGHASPAEERPSIPAASSRSGNDDAARTVSALDSEYHAAVKANDASTIDRILADDFVLTKAGRSLGKTDILKQARDKQARYEHHEIDGSSQKVRVWRDTAVVTETLWVKGTEAGAPVDQKLSLSETFVRTAAGWRYVSGQAVPATK